MTPQQERDRSQVKHYAIYMTTEQTKLAEQHRNTRHDAIDVIQSIRSRWAEKYDFSSSDDMMNEITGAIMNLKQREPK